MTKLLSTARKIDEMQRLMGELQQDILCAAEVFRNICYKTLSERTQNYRNAIQLHIGNYAQSVHAGPMGEFHSRAIEVHHVADDDTIAIKFGNDDHDDYTIVYFTPDSLERDTMEREAIAYIDTMLKDFISHFRASVTAALEREQELAETSLSQVSMSPRREHHQTMTERMMQHRELRIAQNKEILAELDQIEVDLNKEE